jgi:hypothetical protein
MAEVFWSEQNLSPSRGRSAKVATSEKCCFAERVKRARVLKTSGASHQRCTSPQLLCQ